MGAAKRYNSRRAAFPAIKRKLLAHNFDRLGVTCGKVFGSIHRLPEKAHVTARERAWSRVYEVPVIGYFDTAPDFSHHSHESPSSFIVGTECCPRLHTADNEMTRMLFMKIEGAWREDRSPDVKTIAPVNIRTPEGR
jgi:hypothetical protein